MIDFVNETNKQWNKQLKLLVIRPVKVVLFKLLSALKRDRVLKKSRQQMIASHDEIAHLRIVCDKDHYFYNVKY